jgi:hypothetical protein
MKDGPDMFPTSHNAFVNSHPGPSGRAAWSRRADDLIYQGFTVAAMLLVLGTLWVL